MIPIVYFRSSSFNAHRSCPTNFYGEYVLGIRGNSGKKADKGTITHKILELMALCKKAEQDGIHEIDDEDIGSGDSHSSEEVDIAKASKIIDNKNIPIKEQNRLVYLALKELGCKNLTDLEQE